jgi:hypothetical protein
MEARKHIYYQYSNWFFTKLLRVKSHAAVGKYMALRNITKNHTMGTA